MQARKISEVREEIITTPRMGVDEIGIVIVIKFGNVSNSIIGSSTTDSRMAPLGYERTV
jgi:hypothetical protein